MGPFRHNDIMTSGEIIEPISIEGQSYTRQDLLELCRIMTGHTGVPDWKKEVYAFIRTFLDSSGEEIVQKTSGTTGDPKEVRLTREAMLLSARKTLDFLNLQQGHSALLCLPVRYIAGKMMVVRALAGGLDLILQDPSGRPMEGITKDITFAAMVPLQIHESLLHQDPLFMISKLIIGGGALHESMRKVLTRMELPETYLTFGMTETCTHFALKRINGEVPDPQFISLEGVELKLDHRGCLEVNVPGVTPEPVSTNDLVEINESEGGFTWLGRYDNVINSGGIKIIPELLEQQARMCTGLECLILPEADRKMGEKLVLVVEYSGQNPPVEKWLNCLRNSLSTYEIPRRVLSVKELPRNNSMKPDRTSAARLLL
ncbi:MAG: AMP-binding protein [Bacteroidales bacterium]|nr:AMP-binding protein [Bacteroidales bacterium]